jgi:hypothetical protein
LQHLLGQLDGSPQKKLVLSKGPLARIHRALQMGRDFLDDPSLVRMQEGVDVEPLARRRQLALGGQLTLGLAPPSAQHEELLDRDALSAQIVGQRAEVPLDQQPLLLLRQCHQSFSTGTSAARLSYQA